MCGGNNESQKENFIPSKNWDYSMRRTPETSNRRVFGIYLVLRKQECQVTQTGSSC
jgi:hypothetical protein